MDAKVYTKDDNENYLIKTILENEAGLIAVDRHCSTVTNDSTMNMTDLSYRSGM